MAPETPALFFAMPDPALEALLREQAENTPRYKMNFSSNSNDADFLLFCAEDEKALHAAVQEAGKNPEKISMLVIDGDVNIAARDEEKFSALFKKPLRLSDFLESLLAAYRLAHISTIYDLGQGWRFSPRHRELENASGARHKLSSSETRFLRGILEAGEAGLSRKAAMTEIWGFHPEAESHAVESTVYRLRQKLESILGTDSNLYSEGGFYRWKNELF